MTTSKKELFWKVATVTKQLEPRVKKYFWKAANGLFFAAFIIILLVYAIGFACVELFVSKGE